VLRDPSNPDRGFFIAVGVVLGLGVLTLGVGIWAVVQPYSPWLAPAVWRLGAGIFVGPMFILFALAALVRRWKQGPQEPGRHTRT
jgi:hypothetical protein